VPVVSGIDVTVTVDSINVSVGVGEGGCAVALAVGEGVGVGARVGVDGVVAVASRDWMPGVEKIGAGVIVVIQTGSKVRGALGIRIDSTGLISVGGCGDVKALCAGEGTPKPQAIGFNSSVAKPIINRFLMISPPFMLVTVLLPARLRLGTNPEAASKPSHLSQVYVLKGGLSLR
jgi:hypothetical protein